MYYVRYLLTFASVFAFDVWTRQDCQALGHKDGSWGAFFSWCNTNARFSAKWKHPLWICVRRDLFPEWMMQE